MRVYELGRRGEVRSEKKMMIECTRERERANDAGSSSVQLRGLIDVNSKGN